VSIGIIVEKTQLINLNLRTPLFFKKTENLPPQIRENEEFLLFYELDPGQSRNIEPERSRFLGSLLFTGQGAEKEAQGEIFTLPAGKYLFTQCRTAADSGLKQEEWLDLAIEQQKDALWERQKPENKLYIRFLFEDGMAVTQLFRPCV
jgi:hypothetical protein